MPTTTTKWTLGSVATLITGSALNAMANNAVVAGAVFDNTQGAAGDGYTLGLLTLQYKFAVTPTANKGFSIWLARSYDNGTTYEENVNSVVATLPRPADLVIGVGASPNTNAHTVSYEVRLPAGKFIPVILNNNTGQALAATNVDSVLSLTPITTQAV